MDRPNTETPRWTIAPLQTQGVLPTVEIPPSGLTLGRDPSNHVSLPRESFPGVSAVHARLFLEGDELILEDLGSKNGTLVAGNPIERVVLNHGDVFELGTNGPRFAALASTPTDETMEIPRSLIDQHKTERSVGADTMRLFRERLGVPVGTGVEELVDRRTRRNARIVLACTLLLLGGGTVGYFSLKGRGARDAHDLRAQTDALERQLSKQVGEARSRIDEQRTAWKTQAEQLEAARESWVADRQRLQRERGEIQESIARLKSDERTAAGELSLLRTRLEETSSELKLYNPLAIEEARLSKVSQVEQAVVLIEVSLIYTNEETGQTLYLKSLEDGSLDVNFDGRGTPVMSESTGSGFCVDPEGWIISNAHVVHKKDEGEQAIQVSDDFTLTPELKLQVVFSGNSVRHPARLVRWAGEGSEDLALLKIERFPDMPHLPGVDLSVEAPPQGLDVFLIGFPLGKRALQQGDMMIASTFRGIVSRQVDPYLQVDAAVHPGASGGPLIDGNGRILGVVTAMQALDRSAGSSSIGYIIPISRASSIWPPPIDETSQSD